MLRRLVDAGFRVTAQWKVGAYRIDMVVEGGGKRLAIECDGERHHTQENLDQDIQRQMLLERLGWTFLRIRGSEFYRGPAATMRWVTTRLEELGVTPDGPAVSLAAASGEADSLKDRVIRGAAQLMLNWEPGGERHGVHSAESARSG